MSSWSNTDEAAAEWSTIMGCRKLLEKKSQTRRIELTYSTTQLLTTLYLELQ
ncbi:MAG: hypothetical protein CM15mV27_0480 [Caudoviricetes sp.]|nr:MAG: hypothetical protein CM15mV27_0480 [Caudoviricetes sp.]